MGLDMYLFRTKRVYDVTANELVHANRFIEFMAAVRDGENGCFTPIDWNGCDLDCVSSETVEELNEHFDGESAFEEVGYWRKAYHIHEWFKKHFLRFENCDYCYVSEDMLHELLEVCEMVMNDPERAEELLPTPYDCTWYMAEIEETIAVINDIFAETDFENEVILYHANW